MYSRCVKYPAADFTSVSVMQFVCRLSVTSCVVEMSDDDGDSLVFFSQKRTRKSKLNVFLHFRKSRRALS